MSSDHADHPETGPWPMGWALAIGAGLVAAVLAGAIAGASGAGAFVVGMVSFGVFGVLLGAGGVERLAATDASHGDHAAQGHH